MQMLDLVHRRRREGLETIMLCAGQPPTGAPQAALDAAAASLHESTLGYTEVVGDRELREIIATWHSQTYGVDTSADNIVITTGSSGGFVASFLAVLDHGDAVALSCPGYPAYRNILESLGARVIDLVCDADTRFQPTAAMLEALPEADRPKAVIVTSPGNPTGTIIDPAELERIARWCEDNGAVLISDEDYHGMSFGRELASARQFSDRAIVVGTLSKYFSMTGWRVGWLIVPDELLTPIENLQASLSLCAPAISQVAGRAAFGAPARAELDGHIERYRAARAVFLEELPKIGFDRFADPDGGLYLWVDVSSVTDDSEAWCKELVDAIGVALAPGVDFDPINGHKWVRLTLCAPEEETREACRRLGRYLVR
ncbi:pyridoxal phosphate-dependent aminotransferase [Corynebacterium alimapuense]|uniref:Aspartate aminotransferase n=1 Tax=Corynebacterium alimapuense TaxID=1576874 RepID=A0A3M8KBW2_9CORY|nr:pyridoxal phosphate-dependent aminotransferase [Corynebacterium alimapuense]RNE50054.1 aspartate aminotransferase [Corynebacterium alimapuense]